jgi:hypothetical protein
VRSEDNKVDLNNYIKGGTKNFDSRSDHRIRISFSSVNEANTVPLVNKLTYFPKSNFKTPQAHSSSPSMNSHRDSQSKRGLRLSSKKLGNLECKESHNFGEVGESIVNKNQRSRRKHKTKAIYPTHLRLVDNLNFDQSEYDDEQMNEKINDKLKAKDHFPRNIEVRLDYPSKTEQHGVSKSIGKLIS